MLTRFGAGSRQCGVIRESLSASSRRPENGLRGPLGSLYIRGKYTSPMLTSSPTNFRFGRQKSRMRINPRPDHQTDPGLTGAHGLNATIPEANAENRGAVCSQSRRSLPSADGQTEDTRHEEQREQLAAPTIPPGGIFYRR